MLHYNNENMVPQEFPFPAPIMDYIFKNVSATQLLKLYKTCKFFYDKFGFNIIEDFEIRYPTDTDDDKERIVGNSLAISCENPAFGKLRNLWITNSLFFNDFFGDHDELDLGMFSRLTYNKLDICCTIPLCEYEFLVKPPTLRHINIEANIYRSTKTDCLSIEECIERVPHVSKINVYPDIDFPLLLDMTKLLSLERQTKLTSLHIDNFGGIGIPDPLQVVEFFMKHATPDIDYYFEFTNNNADDDIKAFYRTVDTKLQSWKASLQLPPTVSTFIDLTGKTAVITGAAEGIGKATVILFRQLGASVIAVARNDVLLKSLVDECQNISTAGFLHTVSPIPHFERHLLKRIDYKFSAKFDVWVNIVDASRWSGISDPFFDNDYDYSHDLYYILEFHYNLIKEATPYLKKAKGCFINVSKPDDLITESEDVDIIAKLEQSIKNFETELVSSGVRITTVNPGALSDALPRPDEMTDSAYKTYLQKSKKSREEQTAKAIAFLASDSAKLIV